MVAKRNQFLFLFITAFSSLLVIAQNDPIEDINVNRQFWFDYNVNYHKTDNFNIYGDVGFRVITPYVWTKNYVRSGISFTPKPLFKKLEKLKATYHFGLGMFFTNYVDLPNRFEIRPFQGVKLYGPNFKHLRISHYIRFEQQLERFSGSWNVGLRARYMLSGDITFGKKESQKIITNFYVPFDLEFFFNLDNSAGFSDVIRITPGVGYVFNTKWKTELSTSYHYRRFSELENFTTNDIVLRFRVFHTIF